MDGTFLLYVVYVLTILNSYSCSLYRLYSAVPQFFFMNLTVGYDIYLNDLNICHHQGRCNYFKLYFPVSLMKRFLLNGAFDGKH